MPNDDDIIWKTYTKGVKPVGKSVNKKNPSLKKTSAAPLPFLRKGFAVGQDVAANASVKIVSVTLDRSLEKKLRAGTVDIDARIDLHGMTQIEAHAALAAFVTKHVKIGARTLLVITGKGKDNKGVLRTNLSGWLESLADAARILGIYKAAIRHGGDGAFYVLLRKKKD